MLFPCEEICMYIYCKDMTVLNPSGALFFTVSNTAFSPTGDSSDRGGDSLSGPAEEHGDHCGETPTLYTRY